MRESPELKAARLESILTSIGEHVSIRDRALNITWANEKVKNLFGPDMVGRKCYEVFHRRSTPCTANPCSTRLAFEDGGIHEQETTVLDKDGNVIHLHCTASVAVKDSDGNPAEVIQISRDVTRQKIAEEALQRELQRQETNNKIQLENANESLRRSARAVAESEERYQTLIETMNEGFSVIDENNRLTYVNDSLCAMLGYSREELIGNSVFVGFDSANRPILAEQLSRRKKGERSTFEVVCRRKGGGKLHTIVSLAPLIDSDGRYTGTVSVTMDITRWKEAEEALRKKEEQYRLLVENAPAGICEIDYARNRFIRVNDVMCEYSGYTKEELLSMDPLHFIADESKALLVERIADLLAGRKTPNNVTYKIRAKNGLEFWVLIQNRFVYRENKACGSTLIIHDITQLKETEEALRRSENELRLLSSRFLSVQEEERRRIALDLHDTALQKLAYIKMVSGMELKRAEAADRPANPVFLKEVISLMKESISDIRAAIEDLRPSMLDQLGILSTIRDHCREFGKRHAPIDFEVKTDILEEKISEHLKIPIFRILQEALTNIGKHSHATRIWVSLRKRNGKVCLRVSDNGVGFESGPNSNRKRSDGGFGVRSMRERAELSGGRFLMFSAKGKGTTVQATWPGKCPPNVNSRDDRNQFSPG